MPFKCSNNNNPTKLTRANSKTETQQHPQDHMLRAGTGPDQVCGRKTPARAHPNLGQQNNKMTKP